MTENQITLSSFSVGFVIGIATFLLIRGWLRRTTWIKTIAAMFGLWCLVLAISGFLSFFLCRNFGIQTPRIAPFTAAGKHRNPLGIYDGANDYDDGIALGLAKASAIAYKNEGKVRSELGALGYLNSQIHYIARNSNIGVVVVDERIIVIAFRGTDDLKDWLSNFNILPNPSAEWVHTGFKQALDSLWGEVRSIIRLHSKPREIFLTGHSLGGAIATLAAVRLENEGVHVAGLYTFGQPPVGGEKFANIVKKQGFRYYRFINHVDMVADIPAIALHMGEERYFDCLGRLYDRKPFCESLYDRIMAPGIEAGSEWKTHGINRYVELLQSRK
jgi:triacylglycerol lipase